MLAIRMQRTGRKGHAMFRVVVQDSRLTPTSGKVVANLGHYDPHTKAVVVDIEKASLYLSNGAQPSDRVARLLKKEGVKLPEWVSLSDERSRTIRNSDKLRKNQPVEEKVEEAVEQAPADVTHEEASTDAPAEETPVQEATDTPKDKSTEEPTPEVEATEEIVGDKTEEEEKKEA